MTQIGDGVADPDPGKTNNGGRWNTNTRSSGEGNRAAPQSEQSSGAVIRTRERSSSPSRFRLVDRATMADSRTKLGGQPNPTHTFHSIQMASLRSVEDDHRGIRSIIKELAVRDPPPYPSMDLLRLLFWNCRGVGNKKFKRNIVEIIKTHKPEILVLMETKVAYSQMSNFFNRLRFTASSVVDPVGRVGVWIIWDTSQVNVRTSTINSQVIHATVHKENFEEWVLVTVYASPNPTLRAHSERILRTWRNNERTQKFLDHVNNCNFIDLGSSGPRMTWTNNRQGLANTMERLDRAMCNAEWKTMFPEATVKVLPRTYSDHSPLVVFTQGMHLLNLLNRPFRFEAAWMSHPGLIDVIKSAWLPMNVTLFDATSDFTHKVTDWNKETFGNIFKRKRRLLARIEDPQKALAETFTHSLQTLEQDLISQYNETLFQEEMLWFQKSRSKYITLEDKNTRYFHISTLTKRRKLKINALKDDEGNWISNSPGVKNLIVDYFQCKIMIVS
ncbi:hypothetical protein ACSBR2_003739 [Camellia fascicularis]